MNKKGLFSGHLTLIIFGFLFAFSSIIAITMWSATNNVVQNLDNETVNQPTKDKIDELSEFFTWGDYLFVYFFVVMLLAYLVSSVSIPVRQPIFFLIFMGLLIITTLLAMALSNSWNYLIENPNLISAAQELPITTFFMKYYPIFNFFIAVFGALLFYGRRSVTTRSEVSNVDF